MRRFAVTLALLACVGLAAPASSFATSYTWNSVTGSDWNDALNWSPVNVPGPSDDVTIGACSVSTCPVIGGGSANVQSITASTAAHLTVDGSSTALTLG